MPTADDAVKAAPPLSRLETRGLPVITYHLRGAQPEEVEDAQADVEAAKEALGNALIRLHDDAAAREEKAHEALKAARAALAACYDAVKIRALDPERYEQLADEHKDEKKPDGVDADALAWAAFVEGVQGGRSEEWWKGVFGQCSAAERNGLLSAALAVNQRSTGGAIPKD